MLERLKNLMLYAGVGKVNYDRVIFKIEHSNRIMVSVFSGIATFLISVMFILTFFISSVSVNRYVYGAGAIVSLILFIVSLTIAKVHSHIVVFLVYISFSIYFLYGIFIGTITNPNNQTVTFMVMLVFVPMLFIDRPFRTTLAIIFFVLVFIILALVHKTGSVLSTDIMDAIIFGLLSIASEVIINHIKIKNYVLELQLQKLSRFDQLTQMNNRNCYESDIYTIPDLCNKSLTCVYIDVNGLHELNNIKGHEYGDNLLKYVAQQIRNLFGDDYTYRIGGDEFVAFLIDPHEGELSRKIKELIRKVESKNYHIAIGSETHDVGFIIMKALIESAENEMKRNKTQFYKKSVNNRRKQRD